MLGPLVGPRVPWPQVPGLVLAKSWPSPLPVPAPLPQKGSRQPGFHSIQPTKHLLIVYCVRGTGPGAGPAAGTEAKTLSAGCLLSMTGDPQ